MLLWFLAYLGGLLTILSPCILPVLPFVFSRAEQPFRKSGLPLLAGMAVTFAAVSTLAVVGGDWIVHANEWGRGIAMAVLALFALSLIFPQVAEYATRPFTRFGGTLNQEASGERSVGRSFLLGIATGFLWAPCAGPILGLLLTGAAVHGATVSTTFLLFAYALGAATSLAAALAAGGKFLGVMRRYLGADEWVRRILGAAVLLGVLAIALGWDRGLLTGLSRVHTESLEQRLIQILPSLRRKPESSPGDVLDPGFRRDDDKNSMPELSGVSAWINSPPLTRAGLRGHVVLVDFWTYSCINCLRSVPYVQAWAEKYKAHGLVVIGVHTPEFAFEKNVDNVKKAVRDLGLTYPVAIDNQYAVWKAFDNHYWPAHYLIDARGKIRDHHFGEGDYADTERKIQALVAELPEQSVPLGLVDVKAQGAQAPSVQKNVQSPETYVGYGRIENQVLTPPLQEDQAENYSLAKTLTLNQWSLGGRWLISEENAQLMRAPGKIAFRFHARDLHLVLGPGKTGGPLRFVVRLDGAVPGANHGSDVDPAGNGRVREERLYQLIRQDSAALADHTFEIEFLDPGVEVFAFTFG